MTRTQTEPKYIRKHGTKVYECRTYKDVRDACAKIVADGQYAIVNQCSVDGFSASAIVSVYDALSSYTKNKYNHMCDVKKIANISFKLIQK